MGRIGRGLLLGVDRSRLRPGFVADGRSSGGRLARTRGTREVLRDAGTGASGTLRRLALSAGIFLVVASRCAAACSGDCDDDGGVTVAELMRGVNMALGRATMDTCPNMDASHDGRITIDEMITAVRGVIEGCRAVATSPTPTVSPEAPATSRSRTPTGGSGGAVVCGNNVVEPPEMCDDGSVCVVGANVNEKPHDCSDDSQCEPGETCLPKYPPESVAQSGGTCAEICRHDAECGERGQCMPVGGDGCAANCTTESDIVHDIGDFTWATIQFQSLFMDLAPRARQVFTIGKERTDAVRQADDRVIFNPFEVPIAVKARTFQMAEINVPNLACACLRGYEAPRFGPGNSAEGKFACDGGGMVGVDAYMLNDHQYVGPDECSGYHDLGLQGDYVEAVAGKIDVKPGHEGLCSVANAYALSNHGPGGSAMLRMTLALTFQQFPSRLEACAPADPDNPHPWFGPDGKACTDDDPDKGEPVLMPTVTGHTKLDILNVNGLPGRILGTGSNAPCRKNSDCTAAHPEEQCFNDIGGKCGLRDECTCLIPCGTVPCLVEADGQPMPRCGEPGGLFSGMCLVGSFGLFDQGLGDVAVMLGLCSGVSE